MTQYKQPLFSAAAELLKYLTSPQTLQPKNQTKGTKAIYYWQHNKAYRNGEQVRFNGRVWQAQEWNINHQPGEAESTPWSNVKAD